jgi:hypothetical protein
MVLRWLRLLGALALVVAVESLLARVGPHDWPRGAADVGRWLAAPPPEARVVALACLAAHGCLAWLAYALLAVAAGQARWVPGSLRRVAERVLGVALTGVAAGVLTAAPALADGPFDRPAPPARAAPSRAAPAAPGRPAPAAPAHPVPEGPPARAATRTGRPARAAPTPARVVTPGDTLWGIAGADWPRWYAANRATIGADPDLIRPGQRLVPPAGGPA